MLKQLRHLLEMIRFSHTLFALPFALLSAILAWREPGSFRFQDLLGILFCMVFARSAAMAHNRVADRELDARNPRTHGRHIPAGVLGLQTVRLFAALCGAGFVASTLLFLPNRWPLYLSVPVLAFLIAYSYAKRFTIWCHYWLAGSLMLAPLAAWLAIRGTLDWPPVLLGATVFFWVGGFDVLYACQDVDFDRREGLFSIPARWGITQSLRWALASHVGTMLCLFGLWYVAKLGPVFLCGVVLVCVLLAVEHWLVRPDDLTRVNLAFFHVNAVVSVGLLLVGLADVWMA